MKFGVNLNRLGLEMHLVTQFLKKNLLNTSIVWLFSSGNYFVEYNCTKPLDWEHNVLFLFHIKAKVTDYSTVYGIICVIRTTLKNTVFGSFAVGFISKTKYSHQDWSSKILFLNKNYVYVSMRTILNYLVILCQLTWKQLHSQADVQKPSLVINSGS